MPELKKHTKYWIVQILCWAIFGFMGIYISYLTKNELEWKNVVGNAILASTGIITTHLIRKIIIRYNWFSFYTEKLIVFITAITVAGGFFFYFLSSSLNVLFRVVDADELLSGSSVISYSFNAALLILVWIILYFAWWYIEGNRRTLIEKLQMESMVKSFELKTLKAQLNPHFIFNALNSIRALVDENPQRARAAVTELSNILRNSMNMDKVETIPMQKEVDIVRDYLALESIRFEERLQCRFFINADTYDLPVPPMMVQTLVENAVKHGVSRSVSGGVIEVYSSLEDNKHHIRIVNSGQYNPEAKSDYGTGFGLTSTPHRLRLQFGNEATFRIANLTDQTVAVDIFIPVKF